MATSNGHRVRTDHHDERGLTLVELVVTMMVFSIASVVFTTTLTAIQRAAVKEEKRSQLNDQARLAIQTIDRQVRSGNLLYNPSSETDPYGGASGYMIRVYTQANAPTEGQFRCALWLIDDSEQLKYRWWPALQPEDATTWQVIAEGVVNRSLGSAAFTVDSTSRTARVSLYLNADYANDSSATQLVSASLTGRNTSFGYPADVCEDLPSPLT